MSEQIKDKKIKLYIGLDEQFDHDYDCFIEGKDYKRIGKLFCLYTHVKPGYYSTKNGDRLELIGHYRIPSHYNHSDICSKFPSIKEWALIDGNWPCPVGRYEYIKSKDVKYVIDVIFSKRPKDGKISDVRQCLIDQKWKHEEKKEWLSGNHGYWTSWSYDLNTSCLATLVMEQLNQIPQMERTPMRVVRHMGSIISQANSPHGFLYGLWNSEKYEDGMRPSFWKSTFHILKYRLKVFVRSLQKCSICFFHTSQNCLNNMNYKFHKSLICIVIILETIQRA